MPHQWSQRKQLIHTNLNGAFYAELLASSDSEDDNDPLDSSSDEDLLESLLVQAAVEDSRYLNPRPEYNISPKISNFWPHQVNTMNDDKFMGNFGLPLSKFSALEQEIATNPVFHNKSNCKQNSVALQLAVFLYRLRRNGNGCRIEDVADLFAISVGSVVKFEDRVMQALMELKGKYLSWPDSNERERISSEFAKLGFSGCVGIVDGSHAVLFQRPGVDGDVWFSRKKFYGVQFQALVAHNKKILDIVCGWPSSVHDSVVWEHSGFVLQPEEYFSQHEYLLADSGHPMGHYILIPYRSSSSERQKQI